METGAKSDQQTRTAWGELPPELHRAVESLLGSPVVAATSQTAGFSPGSADRVETSSGARAFVKTASLGQNAGVSTCIAGRFGFSERFRRGSPRRD